MPDCPTPHDLERILAGESVGPAVRAHVGACRACQAALETLSDDPALSAWLAGTNPRPWEAPPEAALDRLLERLHRRAVSARPARAGVVSPIFLGPPRQDGDLGSLGPHRVRAELGRGGMGVVYQGFDDDLQRAVAIKVLHPDLTDAKDRQRFLREARIAARFRHEHAVAVHAVVNPPEGLPYLVMEYVDGPALSSVIRTQGYLPPAEAVAIVVQVADGLAAAHTGGLIHRDIKPSNILLAVSGQRSAVSNAQDAAPSGLIADRCRPTAVAKITDFGLARFADQPSTLTREGFLAGTPAYMSPEQAQGLDVDARTDVYSLGVTLYEALTGAVPFRGAPHRVLQQVVREEPRPPRQLNDAIPRDLETVCLKALAKEPGRRYPSARELAEDLRRWQRGEPVRARPAGRVERLARWCRRNPALAGLLAALLVTFTAGFGGVVWQWQRAEAAARYADQQRRQAEMQAAEADRQRGLAEDHLRQTCDVVNQFYTQVSQNTLLKQSGAQPLRRQLLRQALAFFQDFLARRGDAVFLQREAAQAALNVAFITEEIGTVAEAEAAFEQAIERYQRLVGAGPAPVPLRSRLAESHLHRGRVLTQAGRLPEALAATRQAAALMEALAREHPADFTIQGNRLACYGNVANLEVQLGEREAARATYEHLCDLLEQLLRDHPGRLELVRNLGLTENNLSMVVPGEAALACLERARDLREQLVCVNPAGVLYRHDLARTDTNLGERLSMLGRDAEALVSYERAVAVLEALAGENPDLKEIRHHLGYAYLKMAGTQWQLRRRAEAVDGLEKARALYRALRRQDLHLVVQGGLATVCRDLGRRYRELGRPADAAAAFQEGWRLEPASVRGLFRYTWELTSCIPPTAAGDKAYSSADESLRRRLAAQLLGDWREGIPRLTAP